MGAAVPPSWLVAGAGVVLFAVPVGILIAASGNGLSVSP